MHTGERKRGKRRRLEGRSGSMGRSVNAIHIVRRRRCGGLAELGIG